MSKLYADRDNTALDDAGNYHFRHMLAMTGEKLHAKADIAAELGHRDKVIDELKQKLEAAMKIVKAVAHVGCDFGYGEYCIYPDDENVQKARELMDASSLVTDKEG